MARNLPPSYAPYRIVALTTAAFVLLIGWASVGEIDQISRAPGQIIPSGRVQVVQSNDGGVIQKINIQEGSVIRRGDQLVILNQVKIRASFEEARARVAALKTQKSRIEAELLGRPLAFTDDVRAFPKFIANERELFSRRRTAQENDIAALRGMLGLVRQELDMNLSLLKYGDVSRAEVLRLERSVAEIEGKITGQQNKYLADLQTQYAQIDQELAVDLQLLAQRQASLQETIIVAPVDGIIKNLSLTTLGGVLRPGDKVLEIVPTGEQLILEVRVSPIDIAYLQIGQLANVKFDSYDASIYGAAEGKVTYISPDTLAETSNDQKILFYRVRIFVDVTTMHPKVGQKITIQPGMTATAEIKTGRNTVLNFLLKPISKTFSESFGER
jgi:adhesin transport system membrane fusion protein